MELQFQKQEVSALQCVLSQVQNLEQTQELRIPEGMPGVAHILGCWGQVLVRSKEWRRDSVRLMGGVLAWLLYQGEEGTGLQHLETWIPFQMDWDLPGNTPEGRIVVLPLLRFADARSISAGKVLIRVGIGVLARCWTEATAEVFAPEEVPEDVQLLRESWPVRLPREAGEKVFELEEQLDFPPSLPRPEKLLYYRMEPQVSDQKVLANKVVFRGNGNLHVLYQGEDGQVHGWDFDLPFSQYSELESSHSPDAQCDLALAVTALELEQDAEGCFRLKAGLTGQYLVDDRQMLELVGDAWSPFREVQVQRKELELSAILDSRRETVTGETQIPVEADMAADAVFLPDFPGKRREGDTMTLEQGGMVQLLTYGPDGTLRGNTQRVEGNVAMKADGEARMTAVPVSAQVQAMPKGDGLSLRWETGLQVQTTAGQGMPMVTGLILGEKKEPDPGRPSLILRRAGTDRLWDIARASGSTVEAIQMANDLTAQPDPNRILLIPVL